MVIKSNELRQPQPPPRCPRSVFNQIGGVTESSRERRRPEPALESQTSSIKTTELQVDEDSNGETSADELQDKNINEDRLLLTFRLKQEMTRLTR